MNKHNEWEMKNKPSKLRNKYDQSGRSLEKIKKEDQMIKEEKMEEQKFVETTVTNLASKGQLTEKGFYIVYFNTTTPEAGTQEGKHYPCEIGLVRYSIKNGLEKSLHEFISPTEIPFGYRFQAIEKSKKTHNIPPDPNEFAKYENNFIQIFRSIKNFLASDNFEKTILPVYVMPNHKDAAKYIFKFIREKAGQSEETFKFCQLPHLLFELMKVAPGGKRGDDQKKSVDSVAVATKYLDRESFKYLPGLGCNFHEELGINTHYCALTTAKCLAFNIAEICSKPFNVRMQPDRHTPPVNRDRPSAPSRVSTETVKQAVTQETRNSWGTKISVQAAPAGISPIPPDFHPSQVTLGPEAQLFPGLHPDLDERRSQVEDFSQRSEFSYRDSNFQSEDSHRGSLVNSSCDDLGSAKSVDTFRSSSSVASVVKVDESSLMEQISQNVGMLKLPSSADSNNQTPHEVANGSSAFHGRRVVDGICPIPEREKPTENRKVKNEGIQSCEVGGQNSSKGKEKVGMKFKMTIIKQEKAVNTRMKNERSNNVDCLVRKDLKDNASANIETDNKTEHGERQERSNGVQVESSRARFSKDKNESKLIMEEDYAETDGENYIKSALERGSRGLNDAKHSTVGKSAVLTVPDALNSIVGTCEKVVQKNGEVGQRARGRGCTCLGNTVNSTVGKSTLKISGKENTPTVENHSVLTGHDDAVNSTVGENVQKISGAGRGRGNSKIILKGAATNRK